MTSARIFNDREEAGWRLAERLRGEPLERPVVLAIPRGGVVVGAAIARTLGCELDVVLARKLRAPYQPELALGAVSEDGQVYLNHAATAMTEVGESTIEAERAHQLSELARRRDLFRSVRPRAELAGRSVILTDDGIATGSTMIAAIRSVREADPREIVVAVPVGSPERIDRIRSLCDRLVCLDEPLEFWAVGQSYRRFEQVSDEEVVELLREYGKPAGRARVGRSPAVNPPDRSPAVNP